MQNYDVTKKGDHWSFKEEGAKRSIKNSETKAEAIDHMRDFMSNRTGSVKIHKENGRIEEERTYPRSADPRKSRG